MKFAIHKRLKLYNYTLWAQSSSKLCDFLVRQSSKYRRNNFYIVLLKKNYARSSFSQARCFWLSVQHVLPNSLLNTTNKATIRLLLLLMFVECSMWARNQAATLNNQSFTELATIIILFKREGHWDLEKLSQPG